MATGAASKKTATKKSARSTKATGAKTSKSTSSSKTSSRKNTQRAPKVAVPVMRRAKSVSWLAILESLVVGALGVLFLINPDGILKVIFYVVGIFLIVKGVYKIINYFAMHGRYDFYNNDLLYGIVALVFGVIAVVLWEQLGRFIGIVAVSYTHLRLILESRVFASVTLLHWLRIQGRNSHWAILSLPSI